ncbi:MAG: hypothetical protein V7720_03990 [Halioglobus sp.]
MAEQIALVYVGAGNAVGIEAKLLTQGKSPGYAGFNGATEFRAMTDKQVTLALEYLRSNEQEISS